MIKKLMTAAALLAMAGAASAATLYTTGVLDFNKTTKGSYLGKIGAAVPVTVLKSKAICPTSAFRAGRLQNIPP